MTVRVTSVTNFTAWDAFSWPDFYARINIDGHWSPLTPVRFDTQVFAPASGSGWEFTARVPRVQRSGRTAVRIELWEFDGGGVLDGLVDIESVDCGGPPLFDGCAGLAYVSAGATSRPVPDTRGIDLTVNLQDGTWTGDLPHPLSCGVGTEPGAAMLCFSITIGSPTQERLVVTKTEDSNGPLCTPAGCSLREAIEHAEPFDVVVLPASARPYQLTLDGLSLEPPPAGPGTPVRGSHLSITRPVVIEGPRNGGTAVIEQTRADSRVFDVDHDPNCPDELMDLSMSRVTIRGGGAGNNSTALPGHIHGGGIHNHGKIALQHVTITGNRATSSTATGGGGGGIYNADSGKAWLTNVTIAENVATYVPPTTDHPYLVPLGGGIAGPGAFHLKNTVIANNTAVDLAAGTSGSSNCGGGRNGASVGVPAMTIEDLGGNLQFPGDDCGTWVQMTRPRGGTFSFWWPILRAASSAPLSPFDAQRFFYEPLGPAVDGGVDGL